MIYKLEKSVGLHPQLTAANLWLLMFSKYDYVLTYGYRSIQEQDTLYAQGRTTTGNIVTNAKGGESPHNHLLAEDLQPTDDKGKTLSQSENHPAYADLDRAAAMFGLKRIVLNGKQDKPHLEVDNWRAHTNWVRNAALVCCGVLVIGALWKA